LDFLGLSTLKYFKDVDAEFTAKIHNFESVDDYYIKTASLKDIKGIEIPTLFINARDDILSPIDLVDLKLCML
jgi:predicted alpha/beta-fold hydrolase